MTKRIKIIFWTLVGFFILVLAEMFIPAVREVFSGSILFLTPFVIFSVLGLALLILVLKEKRKDKLSKFLLLTGGAATTFFLSVFLHNLFYALNILAGQIKILAFIAEVLSVIFFFMAVPIALLAFLVGLIGSLVVIIRQ